VEHTPYESVRCTEKGEALALELLRKHRLIERLLVDFLGLPWDNVHDLACKLEHYISSDVADNISRALGHPHTCPHGNPVIATLEDGSWRLADASVGDILCIIKITDERPEFLSYLYEVGLLPETQITVTERTPFGDVLTLDIKGREKPLAIGKEVSTAVWVRRE
jgi:DtxR family Mn-dependent transcriptional regulator